MRRWRSCARSSLASCSTLPLLSAVGFGAWGFGFRVQVLGFGVKVLGVWRSGLVFRV